MYICNYIRSKKYCVLAMLGENYTALKMLCTENFLISHIHIKKYTFHSISHSKRTCVLCPLPNVVLFFTSRFPLITHYYSIFPTGMVVDFFIVEQQLVIIIYTTLSLLVIRWANHIMKLNTFF